MILSVFQAIMYLVMCMTLTREHHVLPFLLMIAGLAATIALVLAAETPAARVAAPICSAVQILCGVVMAVAFPASFYGPGPFLAAQHLLIGLTSLFLRAQEAPEQEKRPLIS